MTEKILLGGWCVGTVVAVGMLLVATTWRIQNWKRHPVVRVSRMFECCLRLRLYLEPLPFPPTLLD